MFFFRVLASIFALISSKGYLSGSINMLVARSNIVMVKYVFITEKRIKMGKKMYCRIGILYM